VVRAPRPTALARAAFAAGLLASACKPNLDQTVSIVDRPTILAVRSDPPEATTTPPDNAVMLTALYVGAAGPIASAPIDWAFCTARNPLANLGPVNPECLQASGPWFQPMGVGIQASGIIPDDACRQFGPDVPQPMMGQPQGRPVDPDPTGGYYQPVRALAPGSPQSLTVTRLRLACGLAGAAGNVSADYAKRYHANTNPTVASLASLASPSAGGGSPKALSTDEQGATNSVKAGSHMALTASWDGCPTTDVCGDGFCGPDETLQSCASDCTVPKGCTGAERYAGYDLESQSIVDRREAMAVAWFATAGAFDEDRTGRDSSDVTPSSDNGWTAPTQPGIVHMWVVLRDDRGGTGWAEYALDVASSP
jgi:hypothetical protein